MNYDYFKDKLLKQYKDLTKRLKENSQNNDIDGDGDEIDLIQGNCLAETQTSLNERDYLKILAIKIALTKIDNKTFGLCEECEEEINIKRLEFNPCFKHCVECAEEIERNS
jgi:DnaK suppressor protein